MPQTPQEPDNALKLLGRIGKGVARSFNPKNIVRAQKENKEKYLAKHSNKSSSDPAANLVHKGITKLVGSGAGAKIALGVGAVFLVLVLIGVLASTAATAAAAVQEGVSKVVSIATLGSVDLSPQDKKDVDDQLTDEEKQELESDADVQDFQNTMAQCMTQNKKLEDPKIINQDSPNDMDPQVADAWSIYALGITQDSRPMSYEDFAKDYTQIILEYRDRYPDDPDPDNVKVVELMEPRIDFHDAAAFHGVMMLGFIHDGKLAGSAQDITTLENSYREKIENGDCSGGQPDVLRKIR